MIHFINANIQIIFYYIVEKGFPSGISTTEVRENNQLLPDLVFRSSYLLDMLGLPDIFTEKDLESAIITQIEDFIKELGSNFTFLARQKRITVDATDYYLDLLFFHRELRMKF